jgi:hypothetical protein
MLHAWFTPIAICFAYTSWHFNAFFGTNLLTRCHSVTSCFLLFFYSILLLKEIFSELDKTKAKVPIFLTPSWSPKGRRSRATRRPHLVVAWAPLAALSHGVGPSGAHRPCPSAYIFTSSGKLKRPEPPSMKSSIAAAIIDPSLGGFWSSPRHPTGEGNHHRRPSSSPCLPPEWCVSSSSLNYGSIAVARWLSSPILCHHV